MSDQDDAAPTTGKALLDHLEVSFFKASSYAHAPHCADESDAAARLIKSKQKAGSCFSGPPPLPATGPFFDLSEEECSIDGALAAEFQQLNVQNIRAQSVSRLTFKLLVIGHNHTHFSLVIGGIANALRTKSHSSVSPPNTRDHLTNFASSIRLTKRSPGYAMWDIPEGTEPHMRLCMHARAVLEACHATGVLNRTLEWLHSLLEEAPQMLFNCPQNWAELCLMMNDHEKLTKHRLGAQRWCVLKISQEWQDNGPLPDSMLVEMCYTSLVKSKDLGKRTDFHCKLRNR